jgi:DNA-binding CsgD family transcriptional regulator
LDISVNTVNNHVANIFAKTKVRSRIDLLNLLKQPW